MREAAAQRAAGADLRVTDEGERLKPLVDLMGDVGERLAAKRTCASKERAAA